ncbi:MAG TPA: PorP/SprF family type IX secretion system membrane protein [Bacteroidia bacterium]|nr:PorP/SprF family type IX secretion system membrane protein [Bacteroidia bacterium]
MKKIFFCALVFIAIKSFAQDPQFAHSYSSSLNMNPALAGAYKYPELSMLYRRQLPALYANYSYTIFSYNEYMNILKSGIGAYYLNEIISNGLYNTNSFHLDFSPSILIGDSIVLKPAVEIAYYHKKIDWAMVRFPFPIIIKPKTEREFFDLSAGLLLYQKYFDVGFAVHHITEPNESFDYYNESPFPRRIAAHVAANIPLDEKGNFFLSPNIEFIMQGDSRKLKLNTAAKWKMILLEVGFQDKDEYYFMAGFEDKRFRISFAYDITGSEIRNAAAGSHEFFVAYFIVNEKMKNKKPSLNRVAF